MKMYSLYGVKSKDLEDARIVIEQSLGINMVGHESSYHCGDYYCLGNIGEEHFILQDNFDPVEKEWTEEGFKEFERLLYVNETLRDEEIEKKLVEKGAMITLLRREQL